MKKWTAILFLSSLVTMTCFAKDLSGRFPPISREVLANMGPGCHIRLKMPEGARFPISYSEHSGKGGGSIILRALPTPYSQDFFLGFICYAADDGIVTDGWTSYDESSQQWRIKLTPHDAEMFANAHKTYQLKAVNAQGWAITINDVTGDEEGRQRHLHYCLIKPPKALCGNDDMGYLNAGKKGDLTPYALQILRSIEFIDDMPPAHPSDDSDDIE